MFSKAFFFFLHFDSAATDVVGRQTHSAWHETCALQGFKKPQLGRRKWSRNKILRTQCVVTPSFSIQLFWPRPRLFLQQDIMPHHKCLEHTKHTTRQVSFPLLSATLSTNGQHSGAGADEASSTFLQWSAAQLIKSRAPDMQMGYSQMEAYEKELMWWLPRTAAWENLC